MTRALRDEIRQTKPFTSAEQEAFLSLGRTWAVLEHAFAEALRPYGITPTQYNVLRILRGAGESGLCRTEVMQRLISKVPDTTRLLDRMEAAGLIERERSDRDRRFVTTRVTAAGLSLLAELDDPVKELHRLHLGVLDRTELRTLIASLERVRATV
jgi:DNA-binding MarR family transcriptional regulator